MNTHQIVSAGAPALAEGLWYRKVELTYGLYRVEIRRLRPYYGSTPVAAAQSYPHETTEDLSTVARRAYERL